MRRDEDAAVRGEDATEVGIGSQGGYEAVGAESGDPGADPQPTFVLAHALTEEAVLSAHET